MQQNKAAQEEVAATDAALAGSPPVPRSHEEVAENYAVKKKYFYNFVKRTFDIVSSGFVLIVLSWLILIVLFIKWAEDATNSAYELEIREVSADEPKHKKAKRIVRKDGKVPV